MMNRRVLKLGRARKALIAMASTAAISLRILLGSTFVEPSSPQTLSPNKIEDVRIQGGSPAVSDAIRRYYVNTKTGTNFDPEVIARDIKALYALRYFEDVSVPTPETGPRGGKIVTFIVKERSPESGAPFAFEVASIKMAKPGTDDGKTINDFIAAAWNVGRDMVLGGPDWVRSDRFVIVTKAPPEAGRSASDSEANALRWSVMQRALLVERFKLAAHIEYKMVPVYALTVGKQGAKLKERFDGRPAVDDRLANDFLVQRAPEDAGCKKTVNRINNGTVMPEVECHFMNMLWLSGMLRGWDSGYIDRPVVNRTNLKGNYDFTLHWTPKNVADAIANGAASAGADPYDSLTIFQALKEQLGLELLPQKSPRPSVVIDHIEKPQ